MGFFSLLVSDAMDVSEAVEAEGVMEDGVGSFVEVLAAVEVESVDAIEALDSDLAKPGFFFFLLAPPSPVSISRSLSLSAICLVRTSWRISGWFQI